eukprot:scaffold125754_cov18-Tisochrysis_lutea.AAC.1
MIQFREGDEELLTPIFLLCLSTSEPCVRATYFMLGLQGVGKSSLRRIGKHGAHMDYFTLSPCALPARWQLRRPESRQPAGLEQLKCAHADSYAQPALR